MNEPESAVSPLMREVSAYIARAARRDLPKDVVEKGKHHLLDTLASMVSGSRLLPGKRAISYVKTLGGARQACVAGTRLVTTAANAAFANGMFAHADETDDTHYSANMHPGCGIVPAALAMAEREARDGKSMLRAVVLGYDIGCRIARAFHPVEFRSAGRCNHSFGNLFGASAAAGALAGLDVRRVRHLLSYTAQQASGIRTFENDSEHVLKAYVFGGMTAQNGVAAATMAACGFTGVEDTFTGKRNRNFFSAFSPNPNPEEMTRGLGVTYEIMNTQMKKWSAGSPMQAALTSLFALMKEHKIKADDVGKLVIRTPDNRIDIVSNSKMADVNIEHLLAVALLDGGLTFRSAHDAARMRNGKVIDLKKRIELVPSPELTAAHPPRQGIIEIVTRDGRRLRHHTRAAKGSVDNPMTRAEVAEKAMDLMAPIIGKRRTESLIDIIWNIEKVADARIFRGLLTV